MDSECNFVCSIIFLCFTFHAIRCHGEYFQGCGSNLEKNRLFKLLTVNAKRMQNKHSQMCVDESEIENFKKRREIRRRSAAEARVLKKFSKITDSVRLNVNLAKELYEEAIADWEMLVMRYPRTQVRKVASTYNRQLVTYIETYENFMEPNS